MCARSADPWRTLGTRFTIDEVLREKKMSRVMENLCNLAYEGRYNELKEKVGLKPSLATKQDEVRFGAICHLYHVL